MNNLHYKYNHNATTAFAENNDRRSRFGFNGMLRDDDVKDKLTTITQDEGRGKGCEPVLRVQLMAGVVVVERNLNC
jgi:hypothetical protein